VTNFIKTLEFGRVGLVGASIRINDGSVEQKTIM
jgi:hypothetical protein